MEQDWDRLIQGGLLFDGSGHAPFIEDLAISDGRIAARGAALDAARARDVRDARGRWVMPGLLDIHTHLDLEVELAPGLSEVVRHGTTTVVFGNCSLGTAFGAQRRGVDDPILDCFARVENIPKEILRRCVEAITWQSTSEYLTHLASLPLGPNVVPLIPHSMLRIEVMGVEQSITRPPTETELAKMESLLAQAMQEGYVGFSTDNIPFHYLANQPHTAAKIPSPYASRDEQKRLLDVVRQHDRVWQATPDTLNRLATFKRFLYTSGRLFGKPLRTTALTAIDLVHERKAWKTFIGLARFLNSWVMQGKFHVQVLGAPFNIWCVGPISPVFEEFSTTRPLLECELDDREGRRRILSEPAYVEQFERDWADRKLVLTFQRNLDIMNIDDCPVAEWCGETMGQVYRRAQSFLAGNGAAARSEAEAAAFELAKESMRSQPAFFLHLLREFDRDIRFHFVVGNDRPEILEKLLFDRHTLPGFNDSGAHLINMAFFDGNLQTLKVAQKCSLARVAEAIRRLTRAPADFFGIDAGSIAVGKQADVTIIDPAALSSYDTDRHRQLLYREVLQDKQLVNRSDGVVEAVFIKGTQVWERDHTLPALGTQKLGRPLTYSGRLNA